MRGNRHMSMMLAASLLGALAGSDALKSAQAAPPSKPPAPKGGRRITSHPAAPDREEHNQTREMARRVRQMERKAAKDAKKAAAHGDT